MYLGSQFGRPQPLFARVVAFTPKEKDNMPAGPCARGRLLTSWQLGSRKSQKWAPTGSTCHHKVQSPTTSRRCHYINPPSALLILNLEQMHEKVERREVNSAEPALVGGDFRPRRMQSRNDYSHKGDEGRDHNTSHRKAAEHTARSPEARPSCSLQSIESG